MIGALYETENISYFVIAFLSETLDHGNIKLYISWEGKKVIFGALNKKSVVSFT